MIAAKLRLKMQRIRAGPGQPPDTGNDIAEVIDVQHFAVNLGRCDRQARIGQLDKFGRRWAKLGYRHLIRQVRRSGAENISPVKRLADNRQLVIRILQHSRMQYPHVRQNITQHTVIRRDEDAVIGRYGDRIAVSPYAGIDHHQENRMRRKVAKRRQQHIGRLPDVVRLNGVR